MLEIKNLQAKIGDKPILQGVNLSVTAGSVHAIMGKNGAGKSSLANILVGKGGYDISGEVLFKGQDLLSQTPDERALNGLFMAFQYPVEIPGLSLSLFLRHAKNAHLKHAGQKEYDPIGFVKYLKKIAGELEISDEMLRRSVHTGFSGGEKKRLEVLQIKVLEPECIILDETDSGLDVSALKMVAGHINQIRAMGKTLIIITHYHRLLEYITPDYVHILGNGQITQSGGMDLASLLDKNGYEAI